MSVSPDDGDRLVHLESLGDRDATLWAESVVPQTEKGGGNKIGMNRMLLPTAVTKKDLQRGGNMRNEGLT